MSADVITDDTIAWIEQVDGQFFAWGHYVDVHHPCFPPEAYREEYDVADITHEAVADWYGDFANSTSEV